MYKLYKEDKVVGQKYDIREDEVISAPADGNVPFGSAVMYSPWVEGAVCMSNGDSFLGIAITDGVKSADNLSLGYSHGETVNVLVIGACWVEAFNDGIEASQVAYINNQGKITNNPNEAIPTGRFASSGDMGDIVLFKKKTGVTNKLIQSFNFGADSSLDSTGFTEENKGTFGAGFTGV